LKFGMETVEIKKERKASKSTRRFLYWSDYVSPSLGGNNVKERRRIETQENQKARDKKIQQEQNHLSHEGRYFGGKNLERGEVFYWRQRRRGRIVTFSNREERKTADSKKKQKVNGKREIMVRVEEKVDWGTQ